MESKERCVAVFDGDVPDRAPVCDFGNAAMLGYTGHTLDECRKSPSLVKEIMGKWVADTGADLFFGPIETKGIFMDLPGMEVKLPENDQGSLKSAYFTCPEDVDSKELYDPLDAKSCPNLHRYVIDMPEERTSPGTSSPRSSRRSTRTTSCTPTRSPPPA